MKNVYIKTFGCQMNFHDSERMLGVLREKGYQPVDDPRAADLILFNTCSIRQKAEQKFYSQLGRVKHLKKRNPSVRIGVAGCIAQQEGRGILERVPYVDFVLGPQNVTSVGDVIGPGRAVVTQDNPEMALADGLQAERRGRVRAWVNIMYGCNNFCAYCVVPYTRGREVSRPPENILREIRGLAERGYREVTLLGQNVNSYSGEGGFPALLAAVNDIDGIERIRFVTSHPKDLGEELAGAMKDLEKVCEHIHLPLQSGSSGILERMNRKYTFDEYMARVDMLRKAVPDIAITTDIIAGFPGETDSDHRATMEALKRIEFDGIFAFKYSPRPMTRAAEMDEQVEEEVKSERLSEILELQDNITLKKNSTLLGTRVEVLIDDEEDGDGLSGRTRTNKIVNIVAAEKVEAGTIVQVEIEEARRHSLSGRMVQ